MTEGMCDEMVNGKYRGWADRVADTLSKGNPNFSYANLAIRGKLLHQVIDDQIPVAAKYVTGPETLVSFHAGANDVLRPNYQADIVFAKSSLIKHCEKNNVQHHTFNTFDDVLKIVKTWKPEEQKIPGYVFN